MRDETKKPTRAQLAMALKNAVSLGESIAREHGDDDTRRMWRRHLRNFAGTLRNSLEMPVTADLLENAAEIIVRDCSMRDALLSVTASLTAAVSLLERSPKTGAPSNKMFDQMLVDYRSAIAVARAALFPTAEMTYEP